MHEAMVSYNSTPDSLFEPTKLAIWTILLPEVDLVSKCGDNLEMTLFSDEMMHFTDEDTFVRYVVFIFSKNLHPKAAMQEEHFNQERKK